jgi:hypothetical protein
MRKNFAARLTLMLPLLLTACGVFGIGEDGDRERLQRGRRLWAEQQPSRYHFVMERVCFCPLEIVSPVEISVVDGVVVSRRYVATGAPVAPQYASLFPTMDGLFDLIEDALERRAGRVEVVYEARWGFPQRATLDYIVDAVDDELAFSVRAFTVQ